MIFIWCLFCFVAGVRRSGLRLPSGGIFPNTNWSAKRSAGGDQRILRQGGCSHHAQQANSICPAGSFWQRLIFLLVFFMSWHESLHQPEKAWDNQYVLQISDLFLSHIWGNLMLFMLFPTRSCAVLAELQGCLWQLEWAALGPQQGYPYGN